MTTENNNSIIKISSEELVQHKNKFKSIAICNEEIYESEVIELINEANQNLGTLVLKAEATGDKKGLVLSPDWINGDAPTDVVYTWKALAPDGYTDLTDNKDIISIDTVNNTLTILDQTQVDSAITITVAAYKKVKIGSSDNTENIFVAQSTPYTVFGKGQKGEEGPGIASEVRVYKWSSTTPETGGDGWKTVEAIELYDAEKKDDFLWTCYRQQWTNKEDGDYDYTTPIRMTDYEMGTLMASKENISISQWCEQYERTLIDGSTVATGGLIAETIQSGNYYNFGLKFEDYDSGSGYTAKLNSIVPEVVIVPASYNNKPVLNIDITSFQQENAKNIIKKLAIPSSITTDLFGLLTGYTILEELHIPIHKTGDKPYFNNYFGNDNYEVETNSVPATLNKVYLSGTDDTTIVPLDYFDMVYYPEALKYDVYLTESIEGMEIQEEYGAVNKIYRYGTPEINDSFVTVEQLTGTYSYPNINITGFRITSQEGQPMIHSNNFKVDQEGNVTAKNAVITGQLIAEENSNIAGWSVEKDNISKGTTRLSTGTETLNDIFDTNDFSNSPYRFLAGTFALEEEEFTYNIYDENLGAESLINFTIEKTLNYSQVNIDSVTIESIKYDYTSTHLGQIIEKEAYDIQITAKSYNPDSGILLIQGSFKTEIGIVSNPCVATIIFEGKEGKICAINEDGSLYATTADITGTIRANKGNIGGWEIVEDGIDKKDTNGNSLVGMYSGDTKRASLVQIEKPVTSTAIMNKMFTPTAGQPGVVNVGNNNKATQIISFSFIKPNHLSQNYCQAKVQEDGSIIINYLFVIPSDAGDIAGLSNDIEYTIAYEYLTGETSLVQAPDSPIRFYAGNESELTNKEFIVLEDGSLYATAADISGVFYALEGKIGGWDLTSTELHHYGSTAINIAGKNYYKKSFGLQTGSTGTYAIAIGNLSDESWAQGDFKVTHDGKLYATGAELNGSLITTGIRNVGTTDYPEWVDVSLKIDDGELFINGTSTYLKISGSQYIATGTDYLYKDNGNFEYINLPWMQSWGYSFKPDLSDYKKVAWLGLTTGHGDPHQATSERLMMGGDWYISGDLYNGSDFHISSDANLKNTINNIDEKYDNLFNNLKPRTFKYNNGTSGRLHIGFIAQEAASAASTADISLEEFAAVSIYKPNEDFEEWSLRYGEFVALNTWQIQKLKARVKQAEETIELQDAYIKKLEERIEKLEQKLL